jgi:hypothetical protein
MLPRKHVTEHGLPRRDTLVGTLDEELAKLSGRAMAAPEMVAVGFSKARRLLTLRTICLKRVAPRAGSADRNRQ